MTQRTELSSTTVSCGKLESHTHQDLTQNFMSGGHAHQGTRVLPPKEGGGCVEGMHIRGPGCSPRGCTV